jgi:hypothetical protein
VYNEEMLFLVEKSAILMPLFSEMLTIING